MQPDPTPRAAIAECIRRIAFARTSRGVWQLEPRLAAQLGGRQVDIATAAAARRVGEWLRQRSA